MVLLTVIFPPSEEDMLLQRIFWRRDEVKLIRDSTVRPNIAYSVIEGGNAPAAQQTQLEAIVTEALAEPTKPEGKLAVMSTPGGRYHAKISDAAREVVLE
ncbi:hypothetical protein LTR02_015377 [Friedmanniomyces endolithicus]|nr:hypothetical protein LTR02_015377 [Friedmanniomyces endolithicus]